MINMSHLVSHDGLILERIEEIAKSIFFMSGVSVNVLNADHTKIYGVGKNHKVFDEYHDIKDDFIAYHKSLKNDSIYFHIIHTSYVFSYLVSHIKDDNTLYGSIIIGPILLDSPTEHEINEVIKQKHLSFSERGILKALLGSVPYIHLPRVHYMEKTLASLLSNPVSPFLDVEVLSTIALKSGESTYDDMFQNSDFQMEEEPDSHNYSLEKLYMGKISNGDVTQVIEMFHEYMKSNYFTMLGPSNLRSAKNNAIVYLTLVARASIEGGVDSDYSLTMADYYINTAESLEKYEDLVNMLEKATMKFTNSVLQVSSVNHINVIKMASKYVHNHLSEQIKLQDVADFVGLSPNYFSSLFKREMNLPFADYINQTRIKESQYLLETTKNSILDIAVTVGFNNQNYFTTIFKKVTGITPKQYRMKTVKNIQL